MYLTEPHSLEGREPGMDSTLRPRAEVQGTTWKMPVFSIIFLVIVFLLAFSSAAAYFLLRRLRASGKEPRFLPTGFLKRKWQAWMPQDKYSQVERQRSRELSARNTSYNRSEVEERTTTDAATRVDRHTSVRSVMTLPAYSMSPKESEQVIGREGERAGMDTVVEFPENPDEEESRREEQMESLYQIRLARRQEVAAREARQRERREAQARGDWARLEQLRRESRARATSVDNQSTTSVNGGQSVSAATLIAEHQSRGRDQKVSTVAYGALGHVRHDGTRIRSNSNDSERGGLLDGAAPMGEGENRSREGSASGSPYRSLPPHLRNRSNSSALSLSTTLSDFEQQAVVTPGSTTADENRRLQRSHSNGTSSSSPTANRYTPDESPGSDIGESQIPAPTDETPNSPQPPDYEFEYLDWGDAPAYTEAEIQARRASQRLSNRYSQRLSTRVSRPPNLNLPSINIEGATEPNTPVTPNMR